MDLYHAREHLHDLGKLLAFMLGDQHGDWLAGRSGELDDGDIPALLSAARQFSLAGIKAGELDTAMGYFETNAPGCATSTSAPAACSSAPAPSRRPAHTASGSNSASSSLIVTHPFHPLAGQRLAVLYERRLAGIGHVYICDAGKRGTLALPPGYTDRGSEPGVLALDVRVLADLARVLRSSRIVDKKKAGRENLV